MRVLKSLQLLHCLQKLQLQLHLRLRLLLYLARIPILVVEGGGWLFGGGTA